MPIFNGRYGCTIRDNVDLTGNGNDTSKFTGKITSNSLGLFYLFGTITASRIDTQGMTTQLCNTSDL
jgi:hypothetical protein